MIEKGFLGSPECAAYLSLGLALDRTDIAFPPLARGTEGLLTIVGCAESIFLAHLEGFRIAKPAQCPLVALGSDASKFDVTGMLAVAYPKLLTEKIGE